MRIEEITDQMEQTMLDKQKQEAESAASSAAAAATASNNESNATCSSQNAGSEGSPSTAGPAEAPKKTVDEVVAELRTSPLFMEDLDPESEDIQALQALAFEGTPLENSLTFKDQGNECFKAKKPADAREFYNKGVDLLSPLEMMRRRGETTTHMERVMTTRADGTEEDDGREVEVEDDHDEIAKQRACLESLYVNRAACHLELGNHRSCWTDCGHAIKLNPRNVKAYYRSAKALLAVQRVEEADDACARGLEVDPENKALQGVAEEIIKTAKKVDARRRAQAEREARERRKKALLAAAIQARGIRVRKTEKPPEMEDARVRLEPDEEDPRSGLVVPVLLLYPADYETDFIKAFGEADTLPDHLGYVFPLPWDKKGDYADADAVECFVETVSGGLVKWGKRVPLLKVLGTGNVEIVDDVVKVFVLPKAKAAAWVEEFKKKKAEQKK